MHSFPKSLLAVIALALTFLTPSSLRAEISPEKRAEIDTLVRLTGLDALMNQMKRQMIDSMKTNSPRVPAEVWDRLSAKMDVRQMLDQILPIYDKYYSLEDLRAVNAFYSSPTGKKLLSTLPQVMQESMKVGQEWGERAGKELASEITAEMAAKKAAADAATGIAIPESNPPASKAAEPAKTAPATASPASSKK